MTAALADAVASAQAGHPVAQKMFFSLPGQDDPAASALLAAFPGLWVSGDRLTLEAFCRSIAWALLERRE